MVFANSNRDLASLIHYQATLFAALGAFLDLSIVGSKPFSLPSKVLRNGHHVDIASTFAGSICATVTFGFYNFPKRK